MGWQLLPCEALFAGPEDVSAGRLGGKLTGIGQDEVVLLPNPEV